MTIFPPRPIATPGNDTGNPDAWQEARQRMISLLQRRGINDARVLNAMKTVPRHAFIPGKKPAPDIVYGDHPLPIGSGQTISQPYIVAYMTQLLKQEPGRRVLEIGSGCGYQAAILAELGGEVTGIERLASLADLARDVLNRLGYDRIRLIHGDGYNGLPEAPPFDRIIVSCAPPEIPDRLLQQLADGGRMIVPVGVEHQTLKVIDREAGRFIRHDDLAVRFVPMLQETITKQQP